MTTAICRFEPMAGAGALRSTFLSFRVGIGEYPDGPTGATVLHFPDGATAALDVRDGSPGVIGNHGFVHAIAFARGSLLGLEATSGVAAGLMARGGYRASFSAIPLVSGGIVFDFGRRDNSIYPDKRLGRAALDAAVPGASLQRPRRRQLRLGGQWSQLRPRRVATLHYRLHETPIMVNQVVSPLPVFSRGPQHRAGRRPEANPTGSSRSVRREAASASRRSRNSHGSAPCSTNSKPRAGSPRARPRRCSS